MWWHLKRRDFPKVDYYLESTVREDGRQTSKAVDRKKPIYYLPPDGEPIEIGKGIEEIHPKPTVPRLFVLKVLIRSLRPTILRKS